MTMSNVFPECHELFYEPSNLWGGHENCPEFVGLKCRCPFTLNLARYLSLDLHFISNIGLMALEDYALTSEKLD